MAHRDQRAAVCDGGHGARRRARALSRAALAVLALSAAPALAQEWVARPELAGTGLPDPAAYWGEFGRPGWCANLWLDRDAPWLTAGHARGSLRIDEPLHAPRRLVDPAAAGSFTPITWYDSLRFTVGGAGARQGWSGALVTAEGVSTSEALRGAEAVVDLRGGDFVWDENSIMIGRRDSLTWLRGEALGLTRDAAGSLELSGRHVWGLAGGIRRRRHAVEAGFAQQGVAAALFGTEEESTRDRVGYGAYHYTSPSLRADVQYARGIAQAESFSDYFALSRRDANATEVTARAAHRSGFSASVELTKQSVSRTESDEFESRTRTAWGVVGWAGDLGGGALELDLGAGRHGALASWDVAPSASYSVVTGSVRARAGAERVLHAVWTDLAPGQSPFLQRTWAGVLELGLGATPRNRMQLSVLAGRTQDRALLTRTPLVEYAIRLGVSADPDPYDFGLFSVEARGEWHFLYAQGSAFALSRSVQQAQPQVDPGSGFRAVAGTRVPLFGGEVRLDAYVGAEGVGARESELGFGRAVPSYSTTTLGASATWGDVVIGFRARNLENEIHEEPWEDTDTGLEAIGPGRELRFAVTVRMRD